MARTTQSLTHEQLMLLVARLLGENGRFSLILPVSASQRFQELAQKQALHLVRQTIVQPLPHNPPHRHLLTFARQEKLCQTDNLTIERVHHQYTQAFSDLTEPFIFPFKITTCC